MLNNTLKTAISLATIGLATFGSAHSNAQQTLEEIIVTAQKREQSLQDVSSSISALSGDSLVHQQINSVMDMAASIPNLSIGDSLGLAQITIRGIGLDAFFTGFEPSVAMHLDGAVISRAEAQMGSFFDIDRIEVLRGPSGTLYGRNATGGSINLITKKPTEELQGYGRVTVGNYNKLMLEGAIGGPITDDILGRIAFKTADRDGYGENTFTNTGINDVNTESLRGQVNFIFSPSVDLLLAVEYHTEDDNNMIPTNLGATYPGNPNLTTRSTFINNPRDISSSNPGRNDKESLSANATLNWDLSDQITLKSITNYRDLESDPSFDVTFNEGPFLNVEQGMEYDQLSQEFQFNYTDERLTAVTGLYYFEDNLRGDNNVCLAVGNCDGLEPVADLFVNGGPIVLYQGGDSETTAVALYGNLNFKLYDSLNLILGGRYSYEKREGFTDLAYNFGVGTQLSGGDKSTLKRFDPEIGLEWTPMDDLMIYASYKESYKSGIFPVGQAEFVSGETAGVLKPELVKGFEVGIKGRLLDDTLDIGISAFSTKLTDKQVNRTIPSGPVSVTVFENAAGASIEGLELELNWLATDNLNINMSAGYLDAVFTDYVLLNNLALNQPPAQQFQQAAGNPLPQSPEYTGRIRAEYAFNPMDIGSLTVAVEAQYKDDVYFHPFPDERVLQDSNTTVQANLLLISADDSWSLNIWGKNLTDELYYNTKVPFSACQCIAGFNAPPRTFGMTANYNF